GDAREPVAHGPDRLLQLVARVPDRQAPPALPGHRGGSAALRVAARGRLRDVAQDAAGVHRGGRAAGNAELVHARRRHGRARTRARHVRLRRDVGVQLQQVVRGVHAMSAPSVKGVVFVWIGDGDPAPIEEDVPEEFFDDQALILTGQVYWRCNWEVALENSMDSHVNYVHRNALVVARAGFIARGAQGEHPIFVGNGFGGDVAESN